MRLLRQSEFRREWQVARKKGWTKILLRHKELGLHYSVLESDAEDATAKTTRKASLAGMEPRFPVVKKFFLEVEYGK